MLRHLCACNNTGKFISKAAAEAAARSQARLLERAQAKLLSGGYNSDDGTIGGTNNDGATNVSPKGSDDVSKPIVKSLQASKDIHRVFTLR
eukprot:20558-Heterococcus_DN1.PRE.2